MTEADRLAPDLADPPTMRTGRVCKVDGCGTKHMARGLCQRHYKQWRRHNDPEYREALRLARLRRYQRKRGDPAYMAKRRAASKAAYERRCRTDPGHPADVPDLKTPNQPEEGTS